MPVGVREGLGDIAGWVRLGRRPAGTCGDGSLRASAGRSAYHGSALPALYYREEGPPAPLLYRRRLQAGHRLFGVEAGVRCGATPSCRSWFQGPGGCS